MRLFRLFGHSACHFVALHRGYLPGFVQVHWHFQVQMVLRSPSYWVELLDCSECWRRSERRHLATPSPCFVDYLGVDFVEHFQKQLRNYDPGLRALLQGLGFACQGCCLHGTFLDEHRILNRIYCQQELLDHTSCTGRS